MASRCKAHREVATIHLSGIEEATEKGVVVITSDGRRIQLPRQYAEFFPGRVVIPMWLNKKVNKGIRRYKVSPLSVSNN